MAKSFTPRSHRERAQPHARQKFGLLEKHKDYVLRARDFHSKETRLKALKTKARFRNPDEFYFGMINTKTRGGVHVKNTGQAIPTNVVKLLKSQDLAYITMVKTQNIKKLEKLQAQFDMIQASNEDVTNRTHVKFVEDEGELADLRSRLQVKPKRREEKEEETGEEVEEETEEQTDEETDQETKERTKEQRHAAMRGKKESRAKGHLANAAIKQNRSKPDASSKNILNNQKVCEYKARQERIKQLSMAETQLYQQRHLMGKGRRRKIGQDELGVSKYKWSNERKK